MSQIQTILVQGLFMSKGKFTPENGKNKEISMSVDLPAMFDLEFEFDFTRTPPRPVLKDIKPIQQQNNLDSKA
ncbi:hypothetical protein AY606_11800 [Acinetobacter sp. SFB]|uniref:hypothetical protein n=1 Tax=Acinetobacter sp. SFB TaxID=1805634 RepID=UPI0007D7A9D4|nr:hypothetical protein [Acinetobacter sp. SFB]OAL76657.1 hypothetical protein AY606_11800 [Acinetobacter sp. SFB]